MALIALILALISLLFFWFPLIAAPFGLLAVALAIAAIVGGRERRRQGASEALPILSLVFACLALVPTAIIVVLMVIIAGIAASFDAGKMHDQQAQEADYTTM